MANYWENIAGSAVAAVEDAVSKLPTVATTTGEVLPTTYPSGVDKINWVSNTFKSKINLTQYAKALTWAALLFGVTLTPEQTVAVLIVVESLFTLVTWGLRTFFNK